MSDCPFNSDIAHCPLYIESHNGRGHGCVDDMSKPCMVNRGKMNHQNAILQLAASEIDHPGLLQSIKTVGGMQ